MTKSYQVFVGCPFLRAIRKNYDRLKADLEKETPLHVVLADTVAVTSTDYLLEHITARIRDSAACIFDATNGNPNVSLEVGIAHALPAAGLVPGPPWSRRVLPIQIKGVRFLMAAVWNCLQTSAPFRICGTQKTFPPLPPIWP